MRRPGHATVVAYIALFVALGGTTFAATHLAKDSVGSKQLKKNAVTTAKIKNHAVTGAKVKLQSLGTVPSASNANALGGSPASAFAPSTVVRSVTIEPDGSVDASRSDGVSQANVTHPGVGQYCIDGLAPAPQAAVAQVLFGANFGDEAITRTRPGENQVCNGKQVGIQVVTKTPAPVNDPLVVILH
jgi:hypothetical protein